MKTIDKLLSMALRIECGEELASGELKTARRLTNDKNETIRTAARLVLTLHQAQSFRLAGVMQMAGMHQGLADLLYKQLPETLRY